MADQVFPHDDHNNASGANVFLGARIDEAILGHIYWLAAEVGRHVSHQQSLSNLRGTLKLHACRPMHQVSTNLLQCEDLSHDGYFLKHRKMIYDRRCKGPTALASM
jgi:hypothetical protein